MDHTVYVFCILTLFASSVHSRVTIQRVNAATDPSTARLTCTGLDGEMRGDFYRGEDRDRRVGVGGRITLVPGVLVIHELIPADEDSYGCCILSQGCSSIFSLYVDPVEPPPTTHRVYIRSNFSLPCGITKGLLSTTFTVVWATEDSSNVFHPFLTYNSSQGNGTVQQGVFSYNPSTDVLHVQNFLQYLRIEGSLRIHCTLNVRRPDRQVVTATSSVEITIMYVTFLTKLPTAIVTAHPIVLFQVHVQASGGHANVTWMVDGHRIQPAAARSRYQIMNSNFTEADVNSTNSTLVINEVTDADTTAMVTACASLGEPCALLGDAMEDTTEDRSTAHLIVVPTFENLRLMGCNRRDCPTSVLLSFDLPPRFPVFRNLTRLSEFNLTLTLLLSDVSDPAQPYLTRSERLDSTHYSDLVDALLIPRIWFPREGVYRVQARLTIDGKEGKQCSSLCNGERNIYPPPNCNSGRCDSLVTQVLKFDLFFPAGDCLSMNSDTISGILFSGLHRSLPSLLLCFEFQDSSFICHTSSSGQFNTTLRSLDFDAVKTAYLSISGLPFNVEAVHTPATTHPVTTPPMTTPPMTTSQYNHDNVLIKYGASVVAAIAAVIIFVLGPLGIIWCGRRGRRRYKMSKKVSTQQLQPMQDPEVQPEAMQDPEVQPEAMQDPEVQPEVPKVPDFRQPEAAVRTSHMEP